MPATTADAFGPIGRPRCAVPLIEGKQIDPFRVAFDRCRSASIGAETRRRDPRRARLAYRDVASATNRLTLIAAIVPARAVTTHTLFCLRTPSRWRSSASLRAPQQLRRQLSDSLAREHPRDRSLVSGLPVPLVRVGPSVLQSTRALSEALARCHVAGRGHGGVRRSCRAICARLYNLTRAQFEHVLATFPLVPAGVRRAALKAFRTYADFHDFPCHP